MSPVTASTCHTPVPSRVESQPPQPAPRALMVHTRPDSHRLSQTIRNSRNVRGPEPGVQKAAGGTGLSHPAPCGRPAPQSARGSQVCAVPPHGGLRGHGASQTPPRPASRASPPQTHPPRSPPPRPPHQAPGVGRPSLSPGARGRGHGPLRAGGWALLPQKTCTELVPDSEEPPRCPGMCGVSERLELRGGGPQGPTC